MSQLSLKGGCLCGAISYEVSGDVKAFYHCHCARCRKSSGTGHSTNLMLSSANLVFTAGEALLKKYKIPDAHRFSRQFCTNCGSQVARYVPEIDCVVIPAGSIEGEIPVKPQARIFWESRADWSCDGDELPRYAEYPG